MDIHVTSDASVQSTLTQIMSPGLTCRMCVEFAELVNCTVLASPSWGVADHLLPFCERTHADAHEYLGLGESDGVLAENLLRERHGAAALSRPAHLQFLRHGR